MQVAMMNLKTKTNEQQLWTAVLRGDTSAFEQIVARHQSAVAAVAFNIVGDFSISQDIAQDTFWAAWASRSKLLDANRVRSWLCGIARNLARQWRRKKGNPSNQHQSLDFDPQAEGADPDDDLISKEEESIVWQSLENIPENYREVLVLYYRQGQSIQEVADTLSLSNDAARQRLARGREILKRQVSELIEGVLDRSNPSRTFTARVMAGITGAGMAMQAATANAAPHVATAGTTTAVSIAKLSASSSLYGTMGAAIGTAVGLLGAWIGTWIPAQFAETETERQLLLERSKTTMQMCGSQTLFVIVLTTALVLQWIPIAAYLLGLLVSVVIFMAISIPYGVRSQRLAKQLRAEISPEEDPNLSSWRKR